MDLFVTWNLGMVNIDFDQMVEEGNMSLIKEVVRIICRNSSYETMQALEDHLLDAIDNLEHEAKYLDHGELHCSAKNKRELMHRYMKVFESYMKEADK